MDGGRESAPAIYGALVDRIVAGAAADPRIKAVWLEASDRADLRPPYRRLEVHLAAEEPDFAAILEGLDRLVAGPTRLEVTGRAEVPRFARQIEGRIEGAPVTVVLEKSPLLAKRPRAAVACLLDRTGHLYHVMDFSPQKAPPPAGGR
jgi:hypothetical protein